MPYSYKILGLGLDWDSCIGIGEDIIAANQRLFKHLDEAKASGQYTGVDIYISSNRQDLKTNFSLAQGGLGDCFAELPILIDALQQRFNANNFHINFIPLLLADVYGNLEFGVTFAAAENYTFDKPHPRYFFDSSKVSIIYTQTHDMARRHPNAAIEFHLFDDGDEIHTRLADFFIPNTDLLPQQVNFTQFMYSGREAKNSEKYYKFRESILGSGKLNPDFAATLRGIARQAFGKDDGVTTYSFDRQVSVWRKDAIDPRIIFLWAHHRSLST